jgi:N-acetylneuraminic acid mutarotase
MGEIMGAVVAGKWYVRAGLDTKTDKPVGAVYVLGPVTNLWTARKAMPLPAHHIMTAALAGKIYVIGGA